MPFCSSFVRHREGRYICTFLQKTYILERNEREQDGKCFTLWQNCNNPESDVVVIQLYAHFLHAMVTGLMINFS